MTRWAAGQSRGLAYQGQVHGKKDVKGPYKEKRWPSS